MKRSEALRIIHSTYIGWLHDDLGEHATRKQFSETVLSRLEDAGMSPPPDGWGICEWEPEESE